MTSRGFSFPPPPPPPPQQPQQQQQSNPGYGNYNNVHPSHGGRGAGGPRGRGRGGGHRGRGGKFPQLNQGSYGAGGYSAAPTVSGGLGYYSAPYQQQQQQGYSMPGQQYPNMPSSYPAYSHPIYDVGYGSSSQTGQNQMGSHMPNGISGMGAPMQWNYAGPAAGNYYVSAHDAPNHSSRGGFNGGSNFAGQKRPPPTAEKPKSTVPRTPAPAPVPSFGASLPLPPKPPTPADGPALPKKKKRKYNQLGLTPKTEEHESSEEDGDADEESRLAAKCGKTEVIQFSFNGKVSTLQSPADIANWIAERKKRYPTKARIEEKKRLEAEKAKEAEEARKKKQQEREAARHETKESQGEANPNSKDPINAAMKAKRKAEKLRKKLLKEERKLAKAEADAERAGLLTKDRQKGDSVANEVESAEGKAAAEINNGAPAASAAMPRSSPVDGDTDDETSSSGSDSSSDTSDTSSEESDSDSAPEELTSRRTQPERVPPPSREARRKKPCHQFARRGKCSRGDRCPYSHEPGAQVPKPGASKARPRRSLYQMVGILLETFCFHMLTVRSLWPKRLRLKTAR